MHRFTATVTALAHRSPLDFRLLGGSSFPFLGVYKQVQYLKMSGSGRQKKGKQKQNSNKPSNKSGILRAEPCPELGPKQCDSDAGPALGGTQDTISMHTNSKPSRSSSPYTNDPMYCSKVELENMLMNKLESIYEQAIAKLISFGYSHDVVWNAIVNSGCMFGDEDILANIKQSSLEHIKTNKSRCKGTKKGRPQVVEDLKSSVQNSLGIMIYTLCQAQPNMTKIDAMRHLLMTNFDLGFASILKVLGKKKDGTIQVKITKGVSSSGTATGQGDLEFSDCTNSSFGNKTPEKELEKLSGKSRISVADFNLTPSQQERLKKSVAKFAVAFKAELKASSEETQAKNNLFPRNMSTAQFEWEDSCVDNLMLDSIIRSILDKESTRKSVNQKTKRISILVHDIEEAKDQAKERKEWAKIKVVEAAKKVSDHLLELKTLRIEKRKQKYESKSSGMEQEERLMLRLMELETAIDQTSSQYDTLNKASFNTENGNAEIRAEMEAYKLRTSESDEKLAKVASTEKKSIKKTTSLEKQNRKLLEEIQQEKMKTLQLQQQMVDLKAAQEHTEVVWRQEVKAKELAVNELQEERRLKEEAEVRIKRRQQAFHQKMETDHLNRKGQIRRLEQDIARLEMSVKAGNDTYHLPEYLFSWESEIPQTNANTFQNQHPGSNEQTGLSENERSYDRMCMICMEKEVSVIFLPCAHQVLCAKCNNDYYDKLEARCPCCEEPIDERIHIYGARC